MNDLDNFHFLDETWELPTLSTSELNLRQDLGLSLGHVAGRCVVIPVIYYTMRMSGHFRDPLTGIGFEGHRTIQSLCRVSAVLLYHP